LVKFTIPYTAKQKGQFQPTGFFVCLFQQLAQPVMGFLLFLSYYPTVWIEFQLAKIVKIINCHYKQGENFAILWS
jgi:hypothetical protein